MPTTFGELSRGEPDHALIRAIYDYALWCLQSGDGDTETAAVVGFYEHLPANDRARRDMPNHVSKEDFAAMTQAFMYHATDEQYQEQERLYYGHAHNLKGCPSKRRRAD